MYRQHYEMRVLSCIREQLGDSFAAYEPQIRIALKKAAHRETRTTQQYRSSSERIVRQASAISTSNQSIAWLTALRASLVIACEGRARDTQRKLRASVRWYMEGVNETFETDSPWKYKSHEIHEVTKAIDPGEYDKVMEDLYRRSLS